MLSKDCVEWLDRARQDIFSADVLYNQVQNPRHRPIENILWECQQGAEKALKAYLVNQGVFAKADEHHKLPQLLQACAQYDSKFNGNRISSHCTFLTAYGPAIRYPAHSMILDSSTALRSLNSVKRIYDFVVERMGCDPVYFTEK